MSPAMLSRFDLIFLLLDRPDAERDARLSEHVMAMHSGLASRAAAARSRMLEHSGGGGSTLQVMTSPALTPWDALGCVQGRGHKENV